jgi:hypothetical protein
MRLSAVSYSAAAVLALAACGSAQAHHAAVSAGALARRIPACGSLVTNTPSVLARQDVSCTLQDGSQVEIATFANSNDERHWISDGGSPDAPDPAYAGCCIEGKGWAATVGLNSINRPMDVDFRHVMSAIGGREVTG